MNILTLILAIIVFIAFYRFKRQIEEYVENSTSKLHVNISINYMKPLFNHPFFKNEVIPHLKKHIPEKEIAIVRKSLKKKGWKMSDEELEEHALMTFFEKQTGKELWKIFQFSFVIFNAGSRNNEIVWNNYEKGFQEKAEFEVLLFEPENTEKSGWRKDGSVFLKGGWVTEKRDEERYSVFKVYLYIYDYNHKLEMPWEFNPKNYKVGLLAEIPYQFLRYDRWDIYNNKQYSEKLLTIFNIKKLENMHEPGGPGVANEIGKEGLTSQPGFTVGNEYVEFWLI